MTDYYDILNLKKGATDKEIKKSYRKLAVKWHPDKNSDPGAEEEFKKINEAYGVLSDSDKKSKYDRFGKAGLESGGIVDPEDIFKSFFGGNNPFGGAGNPFGGGGGNPFGGMGMNFPGMNMGFDPRSFMNSTQKSIRRKGPSGRINTSISFKEMFNGAQKKFKINRNIKCRGCNGEGIIPHYKSNPCDKCQGSGVRIERVMIAPRVISQKSSKCSNCNGEGKIIPESAKCRECKGVKFVKAVENINLNIRKGVKHNEIIILKNRGDESENWVEPGNIEICINVTPPDNKYIRRVNNDLCITKKILLREALTGLELKIQHLDGEKILLSSNEIIKPGKSYRINNLGFENEGQVGDLIIDFNIIFPDELDDKRKEVINKILPKRKTQSENTGFKQYNLIPIEEGYVDREFEDPDVMPQINECSQQ